MTEIQMDSVTIIKFHDDVIDFDYDENEEKIVGLISTLMFNKIQIHSTQEKVQNAMALRKKRICHKIME